MAVAAGVHVAMLAVAAGASWLLIKTPIGMLMCTIYFALWRGLKYEMHYCMERESWGDHGVGIPVVVVCCDQHLGSGCSALL